MTRVEFGPIIRIEERHSTAKRIVLSLLGLFPLIAPYELWRGLWPLNAFTPFFAIIVLGALSVGGMFVLSGIAGYDQRWSLRPGRLLIQRHAPFRHSRRVLPGHRIARIEPVRHEWSDGDPSFAVALTLVTGERLETPAMSAQATADALEAALRRIL
jgi:hypothetical protein